ncbi:MAG: EF-P lysine aminoacylase EpmA [Syntrophus sp. (in: bacteria)]
MDGSWSLVKKQRALRLRAKILQELRNFFIARGYLEIETPCLIPAPAPEFHIDTMVCHGWFLQPSPELCMKRLLAKGYDKIFQICRCFRQHERGTRHLPEFTMLEWYRRDADYHDLMEECEDLILHLAVALDHGNAICYQGQAIHLQKPWERITVHAAFEKYAALSVEEALAGDCFDEVLTARVEPNLGKEQPTFLYDYPLALGSLARAKKEDASVAERFELYMGGMELANAFTELTDAEEQRRRFVKEEDKRRRAGKPPYPAPEPFLESLQGLEESAGIALGLDRLVMIFADALHIDDVVAFPPETL